jgi:hypothetical protein
VVLKESVWVCLGVRSGAPAFRRGKGRANLKIMSITIAYIEKDITGFQERIAKAQDQLARLPEGYLEFKQHKAREKQRRDLQGEIKHIEGLIRYAFEGIKIRSLKLGNVA